MKVKLAGFNVDVENVNLLNKVKDTLKDKQNNDIDELLKLEWTPETISASYARISRDPREIGELREQARHEVKKARKSNKAIIFDMGHSSIAEHACFNFDIVNISRLLAEYLEKSRLVSFTEKSQRYIKINDDMHYPAEFKQDQAFLQKFKELTGDLFNTYNTLHDGILPHILEQNPGLQEGTVKYRNIVNLAKEDARYILPLATLTQVGMTCNARSLEKVIRKLGAFPLEESRELARQLYEQVDGYAPSIIKYTNPTDYERDTYTLVKDAVGPVAATDETDEVELVDFDHDTEAHILAGLVVKSTTLDYQSAKNIVRGWDPVKKEAVFTAATQHLNSYDPVLREFEMSDFVFNITITASAFAQMKRHRMATIIDGAYAPALGVKIPHTIIDSGIKSVFMEKIDMINQLYTEAYERWGYVADYILSNAHRKNIIVKCNFRELVHIARLRCDQHAQWDIREICDSMIQKVREKLPLIGKLLCGKDAFKGFYQ